MPYASEAEKLFYELGDINSKKRIAHGASHRINGSKSRRAASLPSDHYTKKELEAMSGPVMTYKMSGITYKEFKKYPDDIKRKFVTNLVEKFGATQTQIAKALDVGQRTFCSMCEHHGLQPAFTHKRMSYDKINAMQSYLRGEQVETIMQEQTDPVIECGIVEEVKADSVVDTIPDVEQNNAESDAAKSPAKMTMDYLHMTFNGEIDIQSIANSLRWIVGDGNECEITIEVRPVREKS